MVERSEIGNVREFFEVKIAILLPVNAQFLLPNETSLHCIDFVSAHIFFFAKLSSLLLSYHLTNRSKKPRNN